MPPEPAAEENLAAEVTPELPWRLVEVEALSGFRLRVRCRDGTSGIVDLANFITGPDAGVFAVLQDEERFAEVRIENGAPT